MAFLLYLIGNFIYNYVIYVLRGVISMKKKFLIMLMMLVLAASFVYAQNNILFASVSPFALQSVETSWNTEHNSDYGWGIKTGYRRFVGPLLLGADLAAQGYIHPGTRVFTNVQLLAKVGGKVVISDKTDLNGEIGAGVEVDISGNVVNFLPVVAGSTSVSYFVKPKLAVVSAIDMSLTWPKSKDSSYSAYVWNYGFSVGFEYDF
jgi:hypothetical protein